MKTANNTGSNTILLTSPLSQHSSTVTRTGRNDVTPLFASNRFQQQSSITSSSTTAATKKAVAHLQSLSDFRPIRTDSDEAVVGEREGSVISRKAPLSLTSSSIFSPTATIDVNRPRSISAGRPRQSGQAFDLVQDVYNRLGISRGELVRSIGDPVQVPEVSGRRNFLSYTNAAAMKSTTTKESDSFKPTRGRSMIQNLDDPNNEQQRSRSLSRGRQFRSIWPPPSDISLNTNTTKPVLVNAVSGTAHHSTDTPLDPVLSPNHSRSNISTTTTTTTTVIRSPEEVAAAMLSSPKSYIRNSTLQQPHQKVEVDESMISSTKSTPIRATTNNNDDKKYTNDMNNAVEKDQNYMIGLPVKERMRAFSEPMKKAPGVKKGKSLKNPTTERNHPPLIDIYAEERMRYQSISNMNSIDGDTEEEKKDDNSAYNGVQNIIRRPSINTTTSPPKDIPTPPPSRGKGALLASAFLSAIHSSPKNDNNAVLSPRSNAIAPTFSFAPINEIAADDLLSAADNGSVSILSSVGSQDEANLTISPLNKMNSHSNGSIAHVRKPSWVDNRSKPRSAANTNGNSTGSSNKGNNSYVLSPGRQQFTQPSNATSVRIEQNLPKQQSHTLNTNSNMIERIIEERVQARVAELERRMEQQIRDMEQQMKEMTTRIANYEREK